VGFKVMREHAQAKSVSVNVGADIPPFSPR